MIKLTGSLGYFLKTHKQACIFLKSHAQVQLHQRERPKKGKQFYCFPFWVAPLWKTGGQLENMNRSVKHYLPETITKHY
jgi:hypothetical protein